MTPPPPPPLPPGAVAPLVPSKRPGTFSATRPAYTPTNVGASKQREMELWQKWKDSGHQPEHLQPLLDSLAPLIQKRVNTFKGRVPISEAVLQAQATNLTIKALERFDPKKAQMGTYLTTNLQGLRRVVIQNQNVSRITEDRAGIIGQYNRAKSQLQAELDMPPTLMQIADRMKMSPKRVELLSREIRKDLLASASPVEDPFIDETPAHREVLALLPYELNPQQLRVFEHVQGLNGKKKVSSTSQLAKILAKEDPTGHWSDSKVSVTKGEISKVIKKYLP